MQKWQHLEKVHKKRHSQLVFSQPKPFRMKKSQKKSCVANYLHDQDIVDRSNPAPCVLHMKLYEQMGDSPYQLQDSKTINSQQPSVATPTSRSFGSGSSEAVFWDATWDLKNPGKMTSTTEVFQTTQYHLFGVYSLCFVRLGPKWIKSSTLMNWCLNSHQLTSFNNSSLKFKTVLALQTKFCWTSSIGTNKLMSSNLT